MIARAETVPLSDILGQALDYAAAGWRSFPTRPNRPDCPEPGRCLCKAPVIPAAHGPGSTCRGECGRHGHGFWDVKLEDLDAESEPEPARRIVLTKASEIEPEPVVWAWEDNGQGRVPAGSFGLYAGREGTGKSSFLIWKTARITTGSLPGTWYGRPRAVAYVAVEDSWKYTIAPRLLAAGADLDLVYRVEVQVIKGDTVSLSLPHDIKLLEEAIAEHGIAMVALDPLISAISDQLDTHVNHDVRRAVEPMVRMADRTGAVVAGIAHFNKSSGTDASSLVTGSGAFKDVARFIFAFAADEDGTLVVTQTKNSLGVSNLPSLDYRIIEAIVPTAKGDARVGRFVPGGVAGKSVHDILAAQAHGGDRDEKTRAEDYLKKALAGGPRLSKSVEEEAREGERISKRTLDRARGVLGVVAAKHSDGWWISLPEHEGDLRSPAPSPAETAKNAKVANPGILGIQAKNANPVPPGEVGTLGILPSDSGGEPPCHHEECWDALVGRCLSGGVAS
jgi:AAA domain